MELGACGLSGVPSGGGTQEKGPLLPAFIPVDSILLGISTHGADPNVLPFLLTQYLENNYR